ncbi:MAG: hypothetical protein JO273_14445 [Methylobacteriaceae bacterium]|nr:hypothetical protein [Methylobacteriaceae bacterium]
MKSFVLSLALLGVAVTLSSPSPALAQNSRSWVASFGSDANACTRTSPCASFSGALSKTNAGGEINCVDQGDFTKGTLFIVSSLIIDCTGADGRLSTPFGFSISVSAGTNDVVILRGLDIGGDGVGNVGILFQLGFALYIEHCIIHDFPGGGIQMTSSSAPMELSVSDTAIINNGNGSTEAGILIQPRFSSTVSKIVLDRVELRNNFFGVKADGTMTTGGVINMTVRDSVSAGNASNGIVGTGNASGAAIVMMIDHSASSHNAAGFGVIADGPKTTIRLGGSSIAGNINGVGVSNGGVLQSYGTNQINGNSNDGIAALTPIGLH